MLSVCCVLGCGDQSAVDDASSGGGKADGITAVQKSATMSLPDELRRQFTLSCVTSDQTDGCDVATSVSFDGPFPFRAKYAEVTPQLRVRRYSATGGAALFEAEGNLGGVVPDFEGPPPSFITRETVAAGKYVFKFDLRNPAQVEAQLPAAGLDQYHVRILTTITPIRKQPTPTSCMFTFECDEGEICESAACVPALECAAANDCVFDADEAFAVMTCSACTGSACTGVGICLPRECGPDAAEPSCPVGFMCEDALLCVPQ
jgi:hypothetical protein